MGINTYHPMENNFLFVLGGFFFFLLNMVEADYRGTKECSNPGLDFFFCNMRFLLFITIYYQWKFRQRQEGSQLWS